MKSKKKDMSLICCDAEADFGTVGVINNKVVNFERNLNFNSVNIKMRNFKGYVYSGCAYLIKEFSWRILKIALILKRIFIKIN